MASDTFLSRLLALFTGASSAGADKQDDKADDKVKSDSAGPPVGEIAKGVDRIRTTSRWIVTAFAAVAAAVVGTAPLDGLEDVDGIVEWGLLTLGLALAIAGITIVVLRAAGVDFPVAASPEQLKLAERELVPAAPSEEVEAVERALGWAGDRAEDTTELERRLTAARDRLASLHADVPTSVKGDHKEMLEAAAWIRDADLVDLRDVQSDPPEALPAPPSPVTFLADARDLARDRWLYGQLGVEEAPADERDQRSEDNAGRVDRLKRLDGELTYVVALANYHRIRTRFDRAKPYIVGGAVATAVGICLVQGAPHLDEPAKLELQGVRFTSAVGVDFAGASLDGARLVGADLSGADLTDARGLTVEAVAGASWTGATCPDETVIEGPDDTCATEERLTPSR